MGTGRGRSWRTRRFRLAREIAQRSMVDEQTSWPACAHHRWDRTRRRDCIRHSQVKIDIRKIDINGGWSDALIGRLFHSHSADVNKFAAEPPRNNDQPNADGGKYNGKIVARSAVNAQPEIDAVQANGQ